MHAVIMKLYAHFTVFANIVQRKIMRSHQKCLPQTDHHTHTNTPKNKSPPKRNLQNKLYDEKLSVESSRLHLIDRYFCQLMFCLRQRQPLWSVNEWGTPFSNLLCMTVMSQVFKEKFKVIWYYVSLKERASFCHEKINCLCF